MGPWRRDFAILVDVLGDWQLIPWQISAIIIMIGVHPKLVTTFKSFLYLISNEKSLVKSQVREIEIACLAAIYVPFPKYDVKY